MSQFFYSFCLTLFHSLWQSVVLFISYYAVYPFLKRQMPSFKRNALYSLLLMQVILSLFTFYVYYSGLQGFYLAPDDTVFSTVLITKPVVEKIAPWVILIYSITILLKSVILVYRWYGFKHDYISRLKKPGIELKLFVQKKAHELGIKRKVKLWCSNMTATPLTYGFLKPVILMPVALLNNLTVAEAEALIIHELTHIKNNDYLLNWLLLITETFFFYNPFVMIITGKIKLEREKNCDVQVLNYQYSFIVYAEALLKVAEFKQRFNFFSIAAVFKNKELGERIDFLLSIKNLAFNPRRRSSLSYAVMIAAMLLNIFLVIQTKHYTVTAKKKNGITTTPLAKAKIDEKIPPLLHPGGMIPAIIETNSRRQQRVKNHVILRSEEVINEINASDELVALPHLDINDEAAPARNMVIPVLNLQTDDKEVIVREETSGRDEAVTKAYKLKVNAGACTTDLIYVLKQGKPALISDSICQSKDSSSLKPAPHMQ